MNSLSFVALQKHGDRAERLRVNNFDLPLTGFMNNMAYNQLSIESDEEGDKGYYDKKKKQWKDPDPKFRYKKRAIGLDDPSMAWVHDVEIPVDGNGKPVSKSLLSTIISKWTAKGLNAEEVTAQFKNSSKQEEQCAAAMFASYAWLKENDARGPLFDFDDIQRKFRDKLVEDEKFRKRFQNMYRMVLVDEAQDTNPIQHQIFDILGEKSDTLAYIGDDRQSIYKFRGAEPQLYIDKARSDFQELRMEMNYRSGANIVNAGEDLIKHNGDRQLEKTCRAYESNGEGTIEYIRPDTHEAGAKTVVAEVKRKIMSGQYDAEDFGIVTRTNAEKDAYIIGLIAAGIPFETKGGFNFFGKQIVKGVLAWTRIATLRGREANRALEEAVKTPNFEMLGAAFVRKLGSWATKAGYTDWGDYLVNERPVLYRVGVPSQDSTDRLADAIEELRATGANNFPALLEKILTLKGSETGVDNLPMSFMDKLVNNMDIDLIRSEEEIGTRVITRRELEEIAKAPLNPLIAISEAKADVQGFLATVDMLTGKGAKAEDKEDDVLKGGRLRINTCHQWKGLEAKELYVLMAGGVWPNAMSDDTDEERRLAYVGITRGKEAVTVVSPYKNYLDKDADVSQFVTEACLRSRSENLVNPRQASVLNGNSFSDENEFGKFIVANILGLGDYE
jgi:DNA helicase-2/ATP-dependent DNA helicase PcrA